MTNQLTIREKDIISNAPSRAKTIFNTLDITNNKDGTTFTEYRYF